MKVIVTRPSPDGEIFAADLARIGAEPILSPVMVIRDREATLTLEGVGALAFTSANAVRSFARSCSDRSLRLFAVGEATAAAARAAGFAAIVTAGGDVDRLAAVIAEAKPTGETLHLAGSDRAGDLVGRLAKKGVAARRAVLYDAAAIDELSPAAKAALATDAANVAVVFFSPRSARLFIERARDAGLAARLQAAMAVCLSAEIAAAAASVRWDAVETATTRSGQGVLAVLGRIIDERKGRKENAS